MEDLFGILNLPGSPEELNASYESSTLVIGGIHSTSSNSTWATSTLVVGGSTKLGGKAVVRGNRVEAAPNMQLRNQYFKSVTKSHVAGRPSDAHRKKYLIQAPSAKTKSATTASKWDEASRIVNPPSVKKSEKSIFISPKETSQSVAKVSSTKYSYKAPSEKAESSSSSAPTPTSHKTISEKKAWVSDVSESTTSQVAEMEQLESLKEPQPPAPVQRPTSVAKSKSKSTQKSVNTDNWEKHVAALNQGMYNDGYGTDGSKDTEDEGSSIQSSESGSDGSTSSSAGSAQEESVRSDGPIGPTLGAAANQRMNMNMGFGLGMGMDGWRALQGSHGAQDPWWDINEKPGRQVYHIFTGKPGEIEIQDVEAYVQ